MKRKISKNRVLKEVLNRSYKLRKESKRSRCENKRSIASIKLAKQLLFEQQAISWHLRSRVYNLKHELEKERSNSNDLVKRSESLKKECDNIYIMLSQFKMDYKGMRNKWESEKLRSTIFLAIFLAISLIQTILIGLYYIN